MWVTFMPSGKKQFVQEGDSFLSAAARAGVLIDGTCAGKGICGKCKIKVLAGKTSPPDPIERSLLTEGEIQAGYRLACRLRVEDDLNVMVPEIGSTASRKKKFMPLPEGFIPKTNIRKYFVKVEQPSIEGPKNDMKRVVESLPEGDYTMDPLLIPTLHDLLEEAQTITATVRGKRIIALEKGNTRHSCYGIALDIGTTTVVAMLWDLNRGELVDVVAKTNPQTIFGADVISRILYGSEKPENLWTLKAKIRDCLNEMIEELKQNNQIDENHIYDLVAVGNTTMSHLFVGANPEGLAKSPFVPVFCDAVDMPAKALGIHLCPAANIHLLPNIAGHVGSDTTAVLLATNIANLKGLYLVIDVGTNGEILLSKDGHVVACSTAAGPAFEGAAIHHGMRAAAGAIEGVGIKDGEVFLQVIDDQQPMGICGSGLMDALAQLLEAGILDHSGKLETRESAGEKGIHPSLVSRLRKGKYGSEFVLAWGKGGEDIVITQKDIREVQLAKGAISAGIQLVLKHMGAEAGKLDQIILTGAFGNSIKKESALRIGLLPQIEKEKVISVGNAAGTGASMALLSMDARKRASMEAQRVEHLELAIHPDFQTAFLDGMEFPKQVWYY
ncbi:MAG TPA: DUF4445 domain-containing protein [Clostridiales bacterium]|nr:DUF4445 domain-containing protein [Clostridiales bacterium]